MQMQVQVGRVEGLGVPIVEPIFMATHILAGGDNILADHPITNGVRQLFLPYSSSLDLQPKPGVAAIELVKTSDRAHALEESFMMVGPETFREGQANDSSEFSEQYVLAALLEGEFQSFFTAQAIPSTIANEILGGEDDAEDPLPLDAAPAGSDFDAQIQKLMEQDEQSGVGDPASPAEGDDNQSATTPTDEDDVPGGGVLYQEEPTASQGGVPVPEEDGAFCEKSWASVATHQLKLGYWSWATPNSPRTITRKISVPMPICCSMPSTSFPVNTTSPQCAPRKPCGGRSMTRRPGRKSWRWRSVSI